MGPAGVVDAVVAWMRVLFGVEETVPEPITSPDPDPDVLRRMHVFLRREPIEEPGGGPRLLFMTVQRGEGGRCPVCGDAGAGRPLCTCRRCETMHHAECWAYAGGCARYACGGAECRRERLP